MQHVQSAITYLDSPSEWPITLPVMGTRICAGFPSPADDFLDGELDLTRILVKNKPATFLWRVTGSSMRDVGIFDGDVVVVDRSVKPKDGVVVVAVINGETSLKLYRSGNPPSLTFANREIPAFPMDDVSQVEIWGVVTWTLHKPRA